MNNRVFLESRAKMLQVCWNTNGLALRFEAQDTMPEKKFVTFSPTPGIHFYLHMTPASDKTDEACMALLAAGDLDAAAVLFRRYQLALFHFFLRLGFAQQNSEDMVQAVFERLLKYRTSYRENMPFRTWLYQIARNVKADAYRQQQRLPQAWNEQQRAETLSEAPVHDQLENAETLAQLEQALQNLPEDQLEVLLLTRYQQLKYAEAGRLLGCSEGAVKVKVFRALQQLRANFLKLEKQ